MKAPANSAAAPNSRAPYCCTLPEYFQPLACQLSDSRWSALTYFATINIKVDVLTKVRLGFADILGRWFTGHVGAARYKRPGLLEQHPQLLIGNDTKGALADSLVQIMQ